MVWTPTIVCLVAVVVLMFATLCGSLLIDKIWRLKREDWTVKTKAVEAGLKAVKAQIEKREQEAKQQVEELDKEFAKAFAWDFSADDNKEEI